MKYVFTIFTIFISELFWKNHVEKEIEEGSGKKALRGFVILTKYHNRGAFLNAGEKMPFLIRMLSLMLTIFAAALFLCSFGLAGKSLLKWGLSLLLGGAFSNTYDRLKRGYVVDYFRLNIPCGPLRKIIFNISDFCIMAGAVMIVAGK